MADSYAWIFIVGIVVFFLIIVILLCFTRASGSQLFSSISANDPELGTEFVETPAMLETLSEDARLSYERAKAWQTAYPPESVATEITLSQYLTIQEKGVAAFEFEADMAETNAFIQGRTEIQFFSGECCVQTNLPFPKNQDVYYFEAKMYEKPISTTVAVGVSTKPFPNWRMPGWNKHSVGYFSHNGCKMFNNPFEGKSYGMPFNEGDVVGVGYRHRTGTVFFTRNGRKIEDAYSGLRWNLFPTIGANGPCQVHVNLGQRGFVFIEANVKKWGLAPMQGTLAPPPAYGSERGSILLQSGVPRTPVDRSRGENIPEEAPLIALDHTSHVPHSQPPEYSSLPNQNTMANRIAQEEREHDNNDEVDSGDATSIDNSNDVGQQHSV
ncbi:Protein ssh4 [Umbelopsis sp. WA50703]